MDELVARVVRPAKFAMVGVANTVLDIGLFSLLVYVGGWRVVPANVLSFCTGVLNSFLMNRHWTFADTRDQGPTLRRMVLFVCFNLAGLGLNTIIVWALAPGLGPLAAKGAGTVVTFGWNYWSSCQIVFAAR